MLPLFCSFWNKHPGRSLPHLPLSVGGWEPNFHGCLAAICKTIFSSKDRRSLFLLRMKPTQVASSITKTKLGWSLWVVWAGRLTCGSVRGHLGSVYVTGCVCAARWGDSFVSAQFLSRLLVRHVTFWFRAYLVIKVFSFSAALLEKISGVGDDLVFNYITMLIIIQFSQYSSKASANMPPVVLLYPYMFLWKRCEWLQTAACTVARGDSLSFSVP